MSKNITVGSKWATNYIGDVTVVATGLNRAVCVEDSAGHIHMYSRDALHPIKTPDKVERERVMFKAIATVTNNTDAVIHNDVFATLYDAGLLTDKKVKPVSYWEFEPMCTGKTSRQLYLYLSKKGYLIAKERGDE